MATATPSYLLIFREGSSGAYPAMSPAEREQAAKDWYDWFDSLAAQGKLQGGHPLAAGGRVVSGQRGERVIDGPFAEAKETVGGFFLLTVASLDEATEIAQQCPMLAHGMSIEVRQVGDLCPLAKTLDKPLDRSLSHT